MRNKKNPPSFLLIIKTTVRSPANSQTVIKYKQSITYLSNCPSAWLLQQHFFHEALAQYYCLHAVSLRRKYLQVQRPSQSASSLPPATGRPSSAPRVCEMAQFSNFPPCSFSRATPFHVEQLWQKQLTAAVYWSPFPAVLQLPHLLPPPPVHDKTLLLVKSNQRGSPLPIPSGSLRLISKLPEIKEKEAENNKDWPWRDPTEEEISRGINDLLVGVLIETTAGERQSHRASNEESNYFFPSF